jgi:hypothetical protein
MAFLSELGVETVRIPELVAKVTPLKPADRIPVWDSELDKTRRIDLSTLRSYILSDGGSTIVPTQSGATVIYVVGDADAGGQIASIPSLAGQFFALRRSGQPLIPEQDPEDPDDGEFAILTGGGFKLKQTGDELEKGERFELVLASAIGGSGSTGGTGATPFIKGTKQINTNFTLTSDHLNLLIQIRLGATAAALTLPDLEDVAVNTIIPVEAVINNTVMCKILTQGGQYIYHQNTSYNNASAIGFYVAPGEQVWFFAGTDGWYAINPQGNWGQIGMPVHRYALGLNEAWPTGQLVPRTGIYVRLWEMANALPFSLVDDSVWNTASAVISGKTIQRPFRGCFSRGNDGTNNFRLPDLTEMMLKGLAAGADTLRYFNHAGGFQQEMVLQHNHAQHGQTAVGNGGTIPALFRDTVGGDQATNTFTSLNGGDNAGPKNLVDNIGLFIALKL